MPQASVLQKIAEEESQFDRKFESLLAEAHKEYEAAGISTESLKTWRKQYEAIKNATRNRAVQQMMQQMLTK